MGSLGVPPLVCSVPSRYKTITLLRPPAFSSRMDDALLTCSARAPAILGEYLRLPRLRLSLFVWARPSFRELARRAPDAQTSLPFLGSVGAAAIVHCRFSF